MAKKNGKNGSGKVHDDDGFEVIGGDSTPLQIGETVEGEYGGVARYLAGKKGKVPIFQIGARTILGATVLKNRIETGKVKVGDTLRVTRLEDMAPKKGQNPAKMFDVRVKRA